MKKNRRILSFPLLLVGMILIFSYACEDDDTPLIQSPRVSTSHTSSITDTSAMSGGDVTDDRGGAVTARGVCWSTNDEPTIADNISSNGSGLGSYTSELVGLNANTTYYVRAYATNSAGTGYGGTFYFTTQP